MFIESLIGFQKSKGRRPVSFTLALIAHVVCISLLIVIPLLQSTPLPRPATIAKLITPPAPAPPPPPPPPARERPADAPKQIMRADTPPPAPAVLVAPSEVPKEILEDEIDIDLPGADPNGVPDGVPDGVADAVDTRSILPVAPIARDQSPIRIGGDIQPPRLIRKVPPRYPAIAIAAGVQGVVKVEATTDTSGRVVDARVTRSIPLLNDAALEAVRQWIYTPVFINGRPHPVIFSVDVEFILRR
ncbi:MAG: TonB family protein [Acidobacteriota bacterium]